MTLRAFPVLYAKDVSRVAEFYRHLDFQEHFRLTAQDGEVGYIALRRDAAELAVTTEDAPRVLAGIEPGPGPRHEFFVYVEDPDKTVAELQRSGTEVLREPMDMPWGERVGLVTDPEGNLVSIAAPPTGTA